MAPRQCRDYGRVFTEGTQNYQRSTINLWSVRTDPCLNWEDTEVLLEKHSAAVDNRTNKLAHPVGMGVFFDALPALFSPRAYILHRISTCCYRIGVIIIIIVSLIINK